MTYTATQLEVIKTFGRKELSDYCLVKVDGKYIFHRDKSILESHYEILGHIPHLEDVFRIAEEKLGDDYEIRISNKSIYFFSRSKGAFEYPYKRGTPLLEQPESVLIELLKLFK